LKLRHDKLLSNIAFNCNLVRHYTMGRLFLMFATKNPVHPVLVTFVGLFDLFYVESLDISISSASYPVEVGARIRLYFGSYSFLMNGHLA